MLLREAVYGHRSYSSLAESSGPPHRAVPVIKASTHFSGIQLDFWYPHRLCGPIGIGRGLTASPLHTTGHTGHVSGGSVDSVSDESLDGDAADPGRRSSCQGGRWPVPGSGLNAPGHGRTSPCSRPSPDSPRGGECPIPPPTPRFPERAAQAPPNPRVQLLEDGWRFREAQVGVPPIEVPRWSYHPRQSDPACPEGLSAHRLLHALGPFRSPGAGSADAL